MNDSPDPERALRDHLTAVAPDDAEFNLRPLHIGIEGWTFFEVIQVGVHDAKPRYYVVREDGTVVTGDPVAELERIARSMEVLEREDPPASKLAGAAAALLSDGTRLVDADSVDRWSDHDTDVDLSAPEITPTNGGLTLTFWVRSTGRGIYFSEFEVTIGPDNDIGWEER